MQAEQPIYRYQAGGTLRDDAPYVYRDADELLCAELMVGEFCYVFNCRQMGKSSLRAKAMRRLMAKGVICVSVDLTTIGTQVSTEQWYADFIDALHNHFVTLLETSQLPDLNQADSECWSQQYQALKQDPRISPVRRCNRYFSEILLGHFRDQKIVIFIDEIDAVLNLDFDASDFFALIRACFNQRADHPEYKRLTFALFGVATPAQLIRDPNKTPFNLGKDVVLTGFQLERSLVLADGLVGVVSDPQAILKEILAWTGGQPFLTQKLCDWVQRGVPDMPPLLEGAESIWIERLVRSHIVENWESQDQPQHLMTIYMRLMCDESRAGRLLGLYQEILQQGEISIDGDAAETDLCLSGLVVREQGRLRIYNRIYAEVFNQQWIDSEFSRLRPSFYAEALSRWEMSGFQSDKQYLLLGENLESALKWEKERKLSDIDYRFLRACQQYEFNLQKEANKILDDARHQANVELEVSSKNLRKAKRDRKRARRNLWLSLGSLVICLLIAIGTGFLLQKQQKIARFDAGAAASLSKSEVSPKAALQEILDYVQQDATWTKTPEISDYPIKNLSLALQKITEKPLPLEEFRTYQDGVNTINFLNDTSSTFLTAGQNATLEQWSPSKQKQSEQDQVTEKDAVFTYGDSSINSFRLDKENSSSTTRLAIGTDSGEALLFPKLSIPAAKSEKPIDLAEKEKIYLWDRNASSDQSKRIAHEGGVFNIRLSRHNGALFAITSGKSDGYLKLWNLNELQSDFSMQWVEKVWAREAHFINKENGGKDSGIRSIDFNAAGNRIITGGIDGTAKLWDLQGQNLCTFNHYGVQNDTERWINSTLFLKEEDGKTERAVTGGQDGFVKIWALDEEGCTLKESVNTGIDGVGVVRFNPENPQQFAVASRDSISSGTGSPVRVWNRKSQLLEEFRGHEGVVQTLRYIQNGRKIVTGGQNDGNVFIWDVSSLGDLSNTPRGSKPLYSIRFCSTNICTDNTQGRYAATAGQGGVILWKFTGAAEQNSNHSNKNYLKNFKIIEQADDRLKVRTVRFFRQGDNNEVLIAAAGNDGKIRFWNLNGDERGELRKPKRGDEIESISFNKDGKYLAVVGRDGLFEVWDLSNTSERISGDNPIFTDRIGNLTLRAVRWSQEVDKVFAVGDNFTLVVWDRERQLKTAINSDFASFVGKYKLDQMPLYSIFVENNNLIKVAGANGKVYTLDLLSKEAKESVSSQSGIRNISFSDDKKLLATAGSGGNLSLWDLSSGRQVSSLEGHRGVVRSVAVEKLRNKKLGKDELWIFSAGDDGIPRARRVDTISDLLRQVCQRNQIQHNICEQMK
jgi:WD40 repeat protein